MGDTHRRIDSAVKTARAIKNLDFIIHLGDMAADAVRIADRLDREVISVKGNCDGDFSENNYKILKAECGNILLVHGHRESVKSGYSNLIYRTLETGCVGAFFGHTHVAGILETDGITLVNPGSLTFPRPGDYPSYAVAETNMKGIFPTIIYIRNH
ncbi:MAG: YfcE family phosphodiesterase [Oscillospiraceae bacterium]|nr:YfcE family phosphodiesterase [Oscillospiraceae bacterium]